MGQETQEGIQQGDVLMKSIAALPEGAKKVASTNPRGVLLAEGEVTGHAHVALGPNVTEYHLDAERYIEVSADTVVTHEEHGDLTIPPGVYQIGIVQERDHLERSTRYVLD